MPRPPAPSVPCPVHLPPAPSAAVVQIDAAVLEQSLALAVSCLHFDFTATCDSDDTGPAHFPCSWSAVVLDPATPQLFCDLYAAGPSSAQSGRCLQCFGQIAAVRQSMFTCEDKRRQWLTNVLWKVVALLKNEAGYAP